MTPRKVIVGGASVEIHPHKIVSTYPDGAVSEFWPVAGDNPAFSEEDKAEFARYAALAGYSDPMQYGLEHDVTHHWVAERLGWEHSRVVWADAHKCIGETIEFDQSVTAEEGWPRRCQDEEHIVNSLQRFMNTGAKDDHGVLDALFGERLPAVAHALLVFLRPWLVTKE